MGFLDPIVSDALRLAVLAIVPASTAVILAYLRHLQRHIERLDNGNTTRAGRLDPRIDALIEMMVRHEAAHKHLLTDPNE